MTLGGRKCTVLGKITMPKFNGTSLGIERTFRGKARQKKEDRLEPIIRTQTQLKDLL